VISQRFPALRRDSIARGGDTCQKTGAVLYCRVSTEDQRDNFSIETQQRQCEALCEREGLHVLQIFTEAASAKTAEGRPQFQAMLSHCQKHQKQITAVVVYAFNRFARNQVDHLVVCEKLRKCDIRVLSVTERFDCDTPEGRLQQSIISMFAQFDNEKRSERTKAGMRTAMEAGKWCVIKHRSVISQTPCCPAACVTTHSEHH